MNININEWAEDQASIRNGYAMVIEDCTYRVQVVGSEDDKGYNWDLQLFVHMECPCKVEYDKCYRSRKILQAKLDQPHYIML